MYLKTVEWVANSRRSWSEAASYSVCFGSTVFSSAYQTNFSGPSCSKLTMSLVNVLLKHWSLIMAYMLFFCWKNVSSFCKCKSYSHFFSKNNYELDIVLTRTVNILITNELVKLTMLWTTGPWWENVHKYWRINPLSASHNYCRLLCHLLVILKVIFANSVDPDQTAALGAVWSGSTLFAYMQNVSLKSLQEDAADDISRWHKQSTFSDAGFLGTLRVKHAQESVFM